MIWNHRHRTQRGVALGLMCAVVVTMGCVRSKFERDIKAQRWPDAAAEYADNSSLHVDEDAIYQAALLHSYPNLETYNPSLAKSLFQRLLRLYPESNKRQSAMGHIALLNDTDIVRAEVAERERKSEIEVARVYANTQLLLARIDSMSRRLQGDVRAIDSLRKVSARLETEAKERDEQLRALRAELAKLKEIDLNPVRRNGSKE